MMSTRPSDQQNTQILFIFMFCSFREAGYLAQLGCELLPEIRETSLYLFRGHVKQREDALPPLAAGKDHGARVGRPRRIFARHQLRGVAALAPAPRKFQNRPSCEVNTIHLPSGDQSGSVGFSTPLVGMR